MGLILPQQIEIKWHPNTKRHYIDLGYEFTRNGDFFVLMCKIEQKAVHIK